MDTISISLHTPLDGFANELCDVLKLFFAVENWQVNPEENGENELLVHTYQETAVCTLDDKKRAFLENARLLQKQLGLVPLMYGSLGLEYLTGQSCNADDVDILIPAAFVQERWQELRSVLEQNGYHLVDEQEHAFEKDGIQYAYASIDSLEEFANIPVDEIKTVAVADVCFKLLSLQQYLQVYSASVMDGYRIETRGKKDAEKIALIEKELNKAETPCKEKRAVCTFSFRGFTEQREAVLPAEQDYEGQSEKYLVAHKRISKRLCKITLYELLKRVTGKRPPWGSLTGIRPTRLIYERLEAGLSMEEAQRFVETEFDVSREKSELLRRIVIEQQKLPAPSVEEADVYISIPFCRTRCAYCSFPGEGVGKGKLIPPYLEALLWEMEQGAELLQKSGHKLRALYVGGGTPSALNEEQFQLLMEETMRLFPGACEYTVEAGRPDTITRGKLETLKRLNVGRISINPQTMNDETLRVIGRDHTAQQAEDAFLLARELGFDDINMDVIAGLPGENAAHFAHTMDRIRALRPDSLTVHTLAIKRSSRLNLEKYPLPDASIAAEMVRLGAQTADELGLEPYYLYRQKYMAGQQQNVGYARPGKACLYNIDIMEETTTILAMGAGAISKRVFPDRELRIERAPNVTNVCVYIDRVQEMARRKENLFLEREEHQ